MPDSFKFVLLASTCIIHLTEVSHSIRGKGTRNLWVSLWSVRRFQNEWTGRWLYFSFTFWLNWQYLPYTSYSHMTCHPGGTPWKLESPQEEKLVVQSSVTEEIPMLTNGRTHFLNTIHHAFWTGLQVSYFK